MAVWSRSLGTDLAMPAGATELPTTPSGDVQLVSGEAAVRQAVRRRVLTTPGTLVHRPGFGAGLATALESQVTPGRRAELAARIRGQVLEDGRVASVTAAVSAGVPDSPLADGLTAEVAFELVRAPTATAQVITLSVAE